MPEIGTQPEYIGVTEASRLTGLNPRTIHRKVGRGELIPVSKFDGLRGAYVFNRSDVEALLERAS